MGRPSVKSLDQPDEETTFPLGHGHVVHLGALSVGRSTHEPGWRWSEHLAPVAGTERCQSHHVGYVVSGRLRWTMADGSSVEGGPGDAFDIPPGHDSMVVGDEPAVTVDWAGVAGASWAAAGEMVVTTLLFTDIVGSTERAGAAGGVAWARLLKAHDDEVRLVLRRHRGREVKHTGDGFLATFDSVMRAATAAGEIRTALRALGLEMRGAMHTGDVVMRAGDVHGVAVHEAARILDLAAPGEILASSLVRELAPSVDPGWTDRGEHALRGLDGLRRLYALEAGDGPDTP